MRPFFHETKSYEEISEELECSVSTIIRWIENFDIIKERMDEMYLDLDLSIDEIASRTNQSEQTIRTWLIKYDIADEYEVKPWNDKEKLKKLYIGEGYTGSEIAEKWGCSADHIRHLLRKHNISKDKAEQPWRKKEVLEELYVEKEWSDKEIAEELGCYRDTISKWLHRHNIPVRGQGGGPWQNKETLYELYVVDDMSMVEVANELGCSRSTISNWLAKNNINSRGNSSDHRHLNTSDQKESYDFKDRDLLYEYYVEQDLSVTETANEIGCAYGSVIKYLDKYGLFAKDDSSQNRESVNIDDNNTSPWRDKELLKRLYFDEGMTVIEISNLLQCSQSTVSTWFKKHDIKTNWKGDRPTQEELANAYLEENQSTIELANTYNVSATTVRRWLLDEGVEIKEQSNYTNSKVKDKKFMEELYVRKGMSMFRISNKLGMHQEDVKEWLINHGVELRDVSEELSGENNPNWKGGEKPYGKGWTEQKRESVYCKYDYKCQGCGITQKEYQNQQGRRLDVHHIIPARRFNNASKRNDISNLVPLCQRCHKKWEGIPVRPYIDNIPQ